MQLLRPSSSVCYKLKLPQPIEDDHTDNTDNKRLTTLNCRTGSAIKCFRSTVFVHGGLVVPLNLSEITTQSIQEELMLYFAKLDNEQPQHFNNLNDWISPHVFTLDLITRKWSLFQTFTSLEPFLKRLYHSIIIHDDKLFMFGGLIVSPLNGYELIASNELYELDLVTKQWHKHDTSPGLIRRYNHSMMIHTDSNDIVRLIIIGGKDNLNQDITLVDIYNLNTNVWESLESKEQIVTNINGHPNGLTKSNNVPVLIEKDTSTSFTETDDTYLTNNNDSSPDIPIIVYYITNENNNNNNNSSKNTTIPSPIVAMPLLPTSQGLRMNSFQDKETLKIPLNLQNLSVATFKKGILVTGFYPTTNRSDFHCYIYDLSCAYWTKIAIDCPDSDFNHHRFNELFVWNSHHRAILLGTETDDHMGPTVQRFDYLLSFRLAMMNVLKEVPRYILDHDKGELVPLIPPEVDKLSMAKRNESANINNTSTSLFENYIKYVTTPLELESTSSVFPPYALVLGKDALEIFGKTISDFEFISATGESIVIPMYLLRKRWGRYFDMLLARAYTQVCQHHDQQYEILPSNIQDNDSDAMMNSNVPRRKSPLAYTVMPKKQGSLSSQHSADKLSPSTSTVDLLSPKYSPGYKDNNKHSLMRNSPIDNNKSNNNNSNNKCEIPVFRVPFQDLSSDKKNDLVDHYPTPPNLPMESSNLSPSHCDTENNQRRSSSVLGSLTDIKNITHTISNERRASHPAGLLSNIINQMTTQSTEKPSLSNTSNPILPGRRGSLRLFSPTHNSRRASILSQQASRRPSVLSQHTTSRRASILSQTSGLSLVSSSSDRRGINVHSKNSRQNSLCNSSDSSSNSLQFELYNVPLPTASEPPMISLPPTPNGSISGPATTHSPHHTHGSTNHSIHHPPHSSTLRSRKGSIEFYPSPRHSSLSTRRSSYESRLRSARFTSRSSSLPDISPGNNTPRRGSYLSARSSVSESSPTPSSASSSASSSPHGSVTSLSPSASSLSLNINDPSTIPNTIIDQLDLEPLLTPRSLYMPWSTETVKAFAEFFYTGKVNGKWTLAPTVLDLLTMSQLYEIPLLYDMITEVLYTLIGKKEETLKLTVNNMVNGYIDIMSQINDGDDEKIEISLNENENYQELSQLKESLDNINNGFLDMHILEKYISNKNGTGRQFSGTDSEISGSTKTYQSELSMLNKRKGKVETSTETELNNSTTTNTDVMFAGGPRDSHDSTGSLMYLRHKSIINPLRKRSILSKEFNIDMDPTTPPPITNKQEEYLVGHRDSITNLDEKLRDFKIRGKSISIEFDNDIMNKERSPSPSTSSDSDLEGEEEYSIGSISSRKIKKELKSEIELDESIDPLLKLNTSNNNNNNNNNNNTSGNSNNTTQRNASFSASNTLLKNSILNQRNQQHSTPPSLSRMNSGNSNTNNTRKNNESQDENIHSIEDYQNITLESLMSTTTEHSMIMVVDYIIKLIYRTSVMVNDSRLMIRCMDCLEFSSILKRIKRNMIKDYNQSSKIINQKKMKKKSSIKISTAVNKNNSINSPVISPMTRQFPIPKRGDLNVPGSSNDLMASISNPIPFTSTTIITTTTTTPSSQQVSPRSSITIEKSKGTSSFPFFGKRKS